MKVVLLTLSGDAAVARNILSDRYPNAEIADFPRSALEEGTMFARLSELKRCHPNVFAIMTESIAWQYGQNALMLFGALAGASESIVLDSKSEMRTGGRRGLIVRTPIHIANSFVRGKLAVQRAKATLDRLEQQVKTIVLEPTAQNETVVSAAYLRATPAAGTQPGGATSHINGVVNGLLKFGTKVTFISNDEIAGLRKKDVKFHNIAPVPDIMPRSAFDIYNGAAFSTAASDLIAASPPRFIYQRYCRFSWAGVEAGLRANVPLFLEYNGSEVWIGKHWDRTEQLDLLERCERLNLRAATRIFVISDVEKNNLLRAGIDEGKIIVNPNGVDADKFKPGVGGEDIRGELGFESSKLLVGFVGTFGPWHGVLALADAIALTPKDMNIHFLLVGDGSLRPEVENRLRDSGDLDRVTFAGVVSHERVPALLDACDILVSPHVPLTDGSDFFGSPTKLFEYMAAGKAIVASDLGQIGEVLSDNKTALLVEPGNVGQLSGAIAKVAEEASLRRRLGEAARAVAVNKHTWLRNAEKVLNAYREL